MKIDLWFRISGAPSNIIYEVNNWAKNHLDVVAIRGNKRLVDSLDPNGDPQVAQLIEIGDERIAVEFKLMFGHLVCSD